MKRLSIVVPCYNEAKNIPLLLERFARAITRSDEIEVVLVDNGSTDQTKELLPALLPAYPFVTLVTVTVNRGYGYGILAGLRKAHGDYLGWTHADLQTDPMDVVRALEIIRERHWPTNIFVKGLRKGRPLFDQFFTIGMSVFETAYLRTTLWDINAQPNIFHYSFFRQWQMPPYDFSLDLYALYLAQKKGLTIERFPVNFPQRIHGTSSWNHGLKAKWKFIKRTVDFSRSLKKNLAGGSFFSAKKEL